LDADGQDYADNVARYAFLCRSVLEYYLQHERAPDLFHLHDWQTALLAVYLRTTYSLPQFAETRSLLTIHNVGYPGIFPAEQIYATGLNWDVFTPEILEYYGKLNLLKGGIVLADAINTVSPTYAEEIQTHAYGRGLDGVLRAQAHKLEGILNGIDTVQWNPATDPHLPERYSISRLSGKKICKRQLQRELGLPLRANALLMGTISRLDHQKGLPLLIKAFPRIADLDVQLVSLGSGDSALAEELRQLSVQYPKQVAVKLGHDESLAHRIVAGCDVFLMPSRYEPCGLTQMYSQRYGTVPVVRNTGGLRDTVTNYTAARLAAGKASGITFGAYDAKSLVDGIRRASRLYFDERGSWNALVKHIMGIDHSWQRSAGSYLLLYRKLTAPATQAAGDDNG
jgi:starch synthase